MVGVVTSCNWARRAWPAVRRAWRRAYDEYPLPQFKSATIWGFKGAHPRSQFEFSRQCRQDPERINTRDFPSVWAFWRWLGAE